MKSTLSLLALACLFLASCNQISESQSQVNANIEFEPQPINYQEEGLIQFAATPNKMYYCIDDSAREVYLYADLKAGEYTNTSQERAPLNLSIVIDRSGSMEGEKLEFAKQAALFVVDQLKPNDFVSIIAYDDYVETIVSASSAVNKTSIKNSIKQIESLGSTNLHGGMMEGYEQVQKNYADKYVNRVLLMSDGLANVGIIDPERLQAIASEFARVENISLSTFGIGIDFNENLMTNLSEYGSGNYYFIESPAQIAGIFEKELNGLLNVIANNTKLRIAFPDDLLELEQVFGYKYVVEEGVIEVDYKAVYAEEQKAALFKFSLKEDSEDAIPFTATLSFNDVTRDDKFIEMVAEVMVEPTSNYELAEKSHSEPIMQEVALYEANYELELAMMAIDERNFELAEEIMMESNEKLEFRKDKFGTNEYLDVQTESNMTYTDGIEEAEEMDESEFKGYQKTNKSLNYDTRKKK